MSMTQRYAGMLRRHAADWDEREMPVQAECCRQAARHMEERERELLAELAELRKNAERYRWLRDRSAWTMCSANGMVRLAHRLPVDWRGQEETAHEMDFAVDAAMQAGVNSRLPNV